MRKQRKDADRPQQTNDEIWKQHKQWLDVTGNETRTNKERLDREPHENGRVRTY